MLIKLWLAFFLVITLTGVSPNHGKKGDVIKLDVTNVPRVSRVMVGKNLCGTLKRSESAIYCIIPPGTGTVDVSIQLQNAEPIVLKNSFTYDQ